MNSLLLSLRQKRSVKYFTFDDSTRGWDISTWMPEDDATSIPQPPNPTAPYASFKFTAAKAMNNQPIFNFTQGAEDCYYIVNNVSGGVGDKITANEGDSVELFFTSGPLAEPYEYSIISTSAGGYGEYIGRIIDGSLPLASGG